MHSISGFASSDLFRDENVNADFARNKIIIFIKKSRELSHLNVKSKNSVWSARFNFKIAILSLSVRADVKTDNIVTTVCLIHKYEYFVNSKRIPKANDMSIK